MARGLIGILLPPLLNPVPLVATALGCDDTFAHPSPTRTLISINEIPAIDGKTSIAKCWICVFSSSVMKKKIVQAV
ncbi:hypothetical protein BDP27DRAFT_1345951 [Rhodocollybia butyracea]|uniref:Secreted protein n=1 Tax=Rhodocollybia butyracea TaxID=206335 RepID=A0A9P5P6R4_9AGAR|nr:hypothetical protein BDP27DRAFT_1345951 [Rhodocollybia butyracea]